MQPLAYYAETLPLSYTDILNQVAISKSIVMLKAVFCVSVHHDAPGLKMCSFCNAVSGKPILYNPGSSCPCTSRLPNFNVNPALNIIESKLSKCWPKCKLSKCRIKCISKKFTTTGSANTCKFFDIF